MKLRTKLLLSSFLTTSALLAGCELAVDFDRSKIPVETPEAGSPSDGSTNTPDATTAVDASSDSATDASADDAAVPSDATVDAAIDDGSADAADGQ